MLYVMTSGYPSNLETNTELAHLNQTNIMLNDLDVMACIISSEQPSPKHDRCPQC